MSSLALMEWNAKPPSQWEWENLISFGAKSAENPKKLYPEGWGIEGLGGADLGSFYSPGFGAGGNGGSGSDLGYTSSNRSSKSASIGSPSLGEMRTSKLSFGSEDGIPEEFCNANEYSKVERTGTPILEASVGSGEPLLSLKLGKRTYFEDASGRSNAKSSSFSVIPVPSLTPSKRSKSNCLNANPPRCQVEGCNFDLSSAKDYHRKHRVCESHSKCPKVIVGGLERRFCQQCSRFHGLSDFDENKRSCRKRLLDHNARRRKPQPETMPLNATNLSSSFIDGRQQMNFSWNKVPLFHSKTSNMMWSSRLMQTEGYTVKPVKTESSDGQLSMPNNGLQNISAALCHSSNGIFPSKGTTEILSQGLSAITSNLDATQDLHRALSLLSTSPGSICEPKPNSLDHTMCENSSGMPQTAVHAIAQSLPAALPDYWQSQRRDSQAADLASHNYCNDHFQEFHQPSVPYGSEEASFYSCQFG